MVIVITSRKKKHENITLQSKMTTIRLVLSLINNKMKKFSFLATS